MATYKVPGDYTTIQDAIDAASFSVERENAIDIGVQFEYYPNIEIGGAFSENRQLTIRPDPEVEGLKRATIANRSHNQPIIKIAPDGNFPSFVKLQDLDIIRDVTNTEDLIQIFDSYKITIERCRIGSIWPSTGVPQKANLHIKDTLELVVRNTIFFSYQLGTLDFGIYIDFYANPENPPLSVLLYNNIVSDYKLHGIHVITGGGDESLLLLRNNVVVNRNTANGTHAFWSNVAESTIVVSSHNTAFVGAEDVEEMVGVQGISGEGNDDFLRRNRARIAAAFVRHTWIRDPLDDPNVNFFRLIRGGSLHHEPSDTGINVFNSSPHERDIAITDDIEKDLRPAGIPAHTDRGPDQIRDDDNFLGLDSLKWSQSILPGGKEIIGHIVLNGLAPEGGLKVTITSTNPAIVPPADVIIASGTNFNAFNIKTTSVKTVKKGKVIVSYLGVSKSRLITVRPIGVASLKFSSYSVAGSNEIDCSVFLELGAAPGAIKVTLKSSSSKVIVPKSVTVRAGQLSATFTVRIKSVTKSASAVISATANGLSKKVTLKLKSK
ncbi:MAG: hypothetical protein JNK77_03975 [Saprospiraceae bacterium]|nr:hypothetical protein [Saprospiraceae bacterium]